VSEPKQFKRGKHTYTHWGTNFKEVRVEGKPKKQEPQPQDITVSMDVDSITEMGVYSNFFMLHRSADEVIIDFCFIPPGQTRGRIRSRVVMPFQQVGQLAEMLNKTADEISGKSRNKEGDA
jgi:hypothetical protein